MDKPKIQPDKITKPIQLLAVWFAGLVLLVGLLLAGAKTIMEPNWIVPVLAISAILIIPIFLYFVFLLQTKYRPQMQEDTYYSKYLDSSTDDTLIINEESKINSSVIELQNQIIQLTDANKNYLKDIEDLVKNNINKDSSKMAELERYISTSNENFNKVEASIKKAKFRITLNKLLPNFSKCRLALLKSGFENLEEFKGGGKKQLERFLISVGINVDPRFVYELIKVLKPFGLEIVNIIGGGGIEEEVRQNEVVVGSHAFRTSERKTINIDDLFIEKLENIENKELFHAMFKD